MHERYRALRVTATLLRVFAWLVAVFASLVVAGAAITTGFNAADPVRGLTVIAVGLPVVALVALLLFAASSVLTLLLDIEQHARAAAEMIATITQPVEIAELSAEDRVPAWERGADD